MAKGNVGNLLQHFVALHAAKRLVELSPAQPVDYIDLFAMAPWEGLDKAGVGFNGPVEAFGAKQKAGDFVADVFLRAWAALSAEELSPRVRQRPYPNTAVLLRTAFPETLFRMVLCEQNAEHRQALQAWAALQAPSQVDVKGEWKAAALEQPKGPALVMLDPYRVSTQNKLGYISSSGIRGVLGKHGLGLAERSKTKGAPPAIAVVFSYGERDPDVTDRALRDALALFGWRITRVVVDEASGNQPRKAHQAWWLSAREEGLPAFDLQDAWDRWSAVS